MRSRPSQEIRTTQRATCASWPSSHTVTTGSSFLATDVLCRQNGSCGSSTTPRRRSSKGNQSSLSFKPAGQSNQIHSRTRAIPTLPGPLCHDSPSVLSLIRTSLSESTSLSVVRITGLYCIVVFWT